MYQNRWTIKYWITVYIYIQIWQCYNPRYQLLVLEGHVKNSGNFEGYTNSIYEESQDKIENLINCTEKMIRVFDLFNINT